MYEFFMNDVDTLEFIDDYNKYNFSNFDISVIDRPRDEQNPAKGPITLKGSRTLMQR